MKIDQHLKDIQNQVDNKNVINFLQSVKEFREKYPQNNKINHFLEKNKKKYFLKAKTTNKYIISIQKNHSISEALYKLELIYKNDSENPLLNGIIGNLYGALKSFDKAIIFQEKSIYLNPFEISFYINLHKTLTLKGEISKSLEIILMAEILDPFNNDVLINLARSYFLNKYYDKSILTYKNLINENKGNDNFKIELCQKLLNANKTTQVYEILKEIKNPHYFVEKNVILGLANYHENKNEKSKEFFLKALHLNKENYKIYSYLAKCFEKEGDYITAFEHHNKAYLKNKNNPLIIKNFGYYYYRTGDFDYAEKYFQKAVELKPHDYEIKKNLSIIQLYKNDFKNGWSNFKYRWLANNTNSLEYKTDLPKFSSKVEFKSVLIWCEQGIGDQILFARFLQNKIFDKKKVYCLVSNKLVDLFSKSFPTINFITKITDERFESHLSMGDLAAISILSLFDLKKYSKPYLKAQSQNFFSINSKLKEFQETYKDKKICGISWISKNDDLGAEKSISLIELIPILELPDYIFIDLQYGDTSIERQNLFDKTGINLLKIDNIDNLNDLNGLASLINFCDQIISISNTTAHLSGSLGKETLLLKSKGRGKIWYWSSDNHQSNWYKSIKIFEQKIINDWKSVVENVRDYLVNNMV